MVDSGDILCVIHDWTGFIKTWNNQRMFQLNLINLEWFLHEIHLFLSDEQQPPHLLTGIHSGKMVSENELGVNATSSVESLGVHGVFSAKKGKKNPGSTY